MCKNLHYFFLSLAEKKFLDFEAVISILIG